MREKTQRHTVRSNNKRRPSLSCHFILSQKSFRPQHSKKAHLQWKTPQIGIIVFILVMKAINYLPLNGKIYSAPWEVLAGSHQTSLKLSNAEKKDNIGWLRQVHLDEWQKSNWLWMTKRPIVLCLSSFYCVWFLSFESCHPKCRKKH